MFTQPLLKFFFFFFPFAGGGLRSHDRMTHAAFEVLELLCRVCMTEGRASQKALLMNNSFMSLNASSSSGQRGCGHSELDMYKYTCMSSSLD